MIHRIYARFFKEAGFYTLRRKYGLGYGLKEQGENLV